VASVLKTGGSGYGHEGTGDVCFNNPENIVSSDDSRAAETNWSSGPKKFYNCTFGFSTSDFPAGSTINGIKVELEGRGALASKDLYVKLRFGASDYPTSQKTFLIPSNANDTWISGGGATDLWGESSISAADLHSSDFGVAIWPSSSGRVAQLDCVRITVYYTSATTASTRLAHKIVPDKQVLKRVMHTIVPDKQVLVGIAHAVVGDKTTRTRLGNLVPLLHYEPEWWDTDYKKRRPISFGTSHDELPIGYTAKFEMVTGYEETFADDGIVNEAIQHGGRHITSAVAADGYRYSYIVWTNDNGQIYIRKRTLTGPNAGTWGTATYTGAFGSGSDTHFYPNILIASDGKLWIFYGGHNNDTKYIISTNAYDETSWGSVQTLAGKYTYPRIFMDKNDDIFVFLREDFETMGFLKYDSSASSWDSFKYVINYSFSADKYESTNNTSVYCGGVAYDTDNDRIHVVLCWWEGYGDTTKNKGRAISHIYSDDSGGTWYDLEAGALVGTASTSRTNTGVVTWDGDGGSHSSPTKIFLSGDENDDGVAENWPGSPTYALGAPFYISGANCTLDSRGYPYFLIDEIQEFKLTPCELWLCRWTGSAWSKTNLSGLTGGEKLFTHRTGGVLYVDNQGTVWVYGFVYDPDTTEEQFGAERFRWRGLNFGTSWTAEYQTKNTAFGCGSMSVLSDLPSGGYKEIVYSRGGDIHWTDDRYYPYIRSDGEDIRIVRQKMVGATYTNTEHDRLPDRYQAEDTEIRFKLQVAVPEDEEHPDSLDRYYVYYSKYDASAAPNDAADVYTFLEEFEYTSGSDMDGQGGWSSSAPANTFRAMNYYDLDEYSGANTNKIVGSAHSLWVECPTTGTPPFTLNKSLSLSAHKISWWQWTEYLQANFQYLELYGGIGNWMRIGAISGTAYYERSTDGGTPVSLGKSAPQTRYNYFEAKIDSNGVSVWVNGSLALTDDTELTSAFTIKIGSAGTHSRTFYDSIKAEMYVANDATITLGTEEGDENVPATYPRMANIASLSHLRDKRLAQKLHLQKSASERVTMLVPVDKTDQERIAHALTTDKILSARSAHLLTPDKITSDRLAHITDVEKIEAERLAHDLDADKVAGGRVAHDLDLQWIKKVRLAHDLDLEAVATARLCNIAVMDKSDVVRIANDLDLAWQKVVRVAHTLLTDKEVSLRMANMVPTQPVGSVRLSNLVALWHEQSSRLAQTLVADKADSQRITNLLALEAEASDRLAHEIVADKILSARAANLLDVDKVTFERVANELDVDKIDLVVVANTMVLDKSDIVRLAQTADLEYAKTVRLCHALIAEKETSLRLAHNVPLTPFKSERLAHLLTLEGIKGARLANFLSPEKTTAQRLSHLLTPDKILASRVAHTALLQASASERLANWLSGDKITYERLAHELSPDKQESDRLANDMALAHQLAIRISQLIVADKIEGVRLAQSLALAYGYISLIGVHITGENLTMITITDENITQVTFTGEDLSMIKIENDNLTQIGVTGEDLHAVGLSDEDLIPGS